MNKRLVIWGSGTSTGGGSGPRKLLEYAYDFGMLDVNEIILVSNYPEGGVWQAGVDYQDYGVRFIHFSGPFDVDHYRAIYDEISEGGRVSVYNALSGWLKMTHGLPVHCTFNIHPGIKKLTDGLHGDQVHQRMIELFEAGETDRTAVEIHFVPDNGVYDCGPSCFYYPIKMYKGESLRDLQRRVNTVEHWWQWYVTNLIVNDIIYCTKEHTPRVCVPRGYKFLPPYSDAFFR